jgi:hypothetical protein
VLTRSHDGAQDSSAFRERKRCQVSVLVNQDVECVIDNPRFCGAEVLQKIEVWPAIGTQGYQLSVDHRTFW